MPNSDGQVTLLLADLVDTRATEERGARGTATREDFRTVLLEAGQSERGEPVEVGHRLGLVFDTASAAARAAARCQSRVLELATAPARVRMAIASGVCQGPGSQCSGQVVDLAARVVAVAHGGQVLVTESAASLLREHADVHHLVDLGRHRLKDLGSPQRVFQLSIPGLRSEFGALRSLDNPDLPNNLPMLLSPFVGRAGEVEEVRRLLDGSRLVTLTGAGGAGKTRLSLQAAAEALDGSGDGVWLVELASVTDEQRLPMAIVASLELPEPDTDPAEMLLQALSAQHVLLVLDNCEHLIESVAKLVDRLLRTCPGVQVLATSREPLGLEGERVYRVPSMTLPDEEVLSVGEARQSDAAVLFMDRAIDAGASFTDRDAGLIASVCRRLDGIPLALELAAARLTSLSLDELAGHLDQRFRLLTGGARNAMARQQTLQALVDWSYELLSPLEQQVLQRISVFSGSFDLAAAEAICAGPDIDDIDIVNLLHSLVDKSLVVADSDDGATRYRLLETIRQYGAIKLLSAEGEEGVLEARERHARHYLELAHHASPKLCGPELGAWIRRLEREASNLDVTIDFLAEDRPIDMLRLVADIERFFTIRGAVDVLAPTLRAISRIDHEDRNNTETVCAGLIVACTMIEWHLMGQRDEIAASVRYAKRAEELAVRARSASLETRALTREIMPSLYQGDVARAVDYVQRAGAAARHCRDDALLCDVLATSLHPHLLEHQRLSGDDARRIADEALEAANRSQDPSLIVRAKFWCATIALQQGRVEESRRMFEETLDLTYQIGAHDGVALNNYLIACLSQGDFGAALLPLRKCLRRMRRAGFRSNPGDLIAAGACIATSRGDNLEGAQLHGAAEAIRAPAYESGELFKSPADVEMELRSVERCRSAIGPTEYDKAHEEGRHLSMAQACDLALAILR